MTFSEKKYMLEQYELPGQFAIEKGLCRVTGAIEVEEYKVWEL